MRFVAEYVAFVQFVGAFNFVFLTKFFHEHFSDHFVNISNKQRADFDTIKNKMTADLTTIKSHEPIVSGGSSNQHELTSALTHYTDSLKEVDAVGERIAERIVKQKQPRYSRQLFLLIGLYSMLAVLFMCKIGHLCAHNTDSSVWCNTFHVFNVTTILWWLYFIVSELIWLFRTKTTPNPRIVSPSFSWTIFLFFVAICCLITWRSNLPIIKLRNSDLYLALFLPLLAFVSSIILFIGTNAKSWILTMFHVRRYRLRLRNLTKEKDHVLSPYAHLRATSFTIS